MPDALRTKLDPRARRIFNVALRNSEVALRREVDRGTLTAAAGLDLELTEHLRADMLMLRVLVKIAAGTSPPETPPADWIRIVDHFYAVRIAPGLLGELTRQR